MARASVLRDAGFGNVISYSRKVFVPLTQLCRDVCHYCTFAQPPKPGERAYMTIDEVLDVARQGADTGCREALFTLGDKPELRYSQAREELAAMGYSSTIAYLLAAARARMPKDLCEKIRGLRAMGMRGYPRRCSIG